MADDKIVIEYSAKITQLEASLNKVEKELKDVDNAGKRAFDDVSKESKKASTQIDKTAKSVDSLSSKFSDLANQLPFAGQIKQVLELGKTVTSLGTSAKSASTGFNVLKVALASTGITLLIAAVVSLIAYFKRTDEGATRLQGVMSGLNAVMDLITGSVIEFGEATFKAFKSVDAFKAGLSDLGDFLINNLVNRLKAPLVMLEALQLAIGGDFQKASLKWLDAVAQFSSGITDMTSKTVAFIEDAAEAAMITYEWEKRLDALNDKVRDNSVVIAQNEKEISKLIIASKNKQLSDEESLAKLEQAGRLEKENLAITLSNERERLKLIQEKNKRESDSINQDIKNGETRRSINDELAQEETDQILKIINLEKSSADLQEKIENRKDQKREEIFQNNLKRLASEETERESFAKAQFLNETINAKELEEELYKIRLQGLRNQRQLLIDNSRSTVDIDKAILDLELSNQLKSDKEKAELKKEANDRQVKETQDRLKKEAEYKAEADRKDAEREKQHQNNINQIRQAAVGIAQELVSGFYDASAQKRQNEFQEELKVSQEKTDAQLAALQTQLNNGQITQAEFDKQKEILTRKQAQKEAEIKRKSFIAEKKAKLIGVAIDTAAAVVKTLATLGIPAGLVASAIAVASGAAQAAIISAQPIPKFKDGVIGLKGAGTETSDSIPAMLSKNESVMTAKETRNYGNVLSAIRNDTFDDFVKDTYVLPALRSIDIKNNRARAERTSENSRKLDAILSNIHLDTAKLEGYVKNNNNVGIKNTRQLAKDMAREMQIGSNWYK